MPNVDRFITYLEFVEARHGLWERRQAGWPQDAWTTDPILAGAKFTNVFRILDPGTQYVLRLMDEAPTDRAAMMRAFLYRHTGRVEAWEALEPLVGWPDTAGDLRDVLEVWKAYRGPGRQVSRNRKGPSPSGAGGGEIKTVYPRSVFTGAYLVFPQSQVPGTDKMTSIIDLTKRLFHAMSPEYVMDELRDAPSAAARFKALRSRKGVGDFMAMQTLTDMGYSKWWEANEDEFVVPGPGARKGLADLGFPATEASIRQIQSTIHELDDCPRLGLPDGRDRLPSLMDVQNTLCEWSKYARILDSGKVPPRYRPAHPEGLPAPVLPAHW